MKYLLCLLTAGLLFGCSTRWTHPEYTPERFEKDNRECEDRSLEMAKKGSQRREQEIFATCMQGKGWTQTIQDRLPPVKPQ
ncbi:hypothetical protein AYO46_07500 [Betaproteobacteria bacterium SCGC AG-212-J23]|nr:hypothetical protein AYO46_07500 [Betaproteobacteria bacterium SCGC AG-212-J23]